jgi:hypothetical protein
MRSRDALHLKVAWLHHTYIHMGKKKKKTTSTLMKELERGRLYLLHIAIRRIVSMKS